MIGTQTLFITLFSSAIVLLLAWLVSVRLLRLVAVVQQKEYRWDRLRSFWSTPAGKREFLLPVLLPIAWRPRQLKHPRLTPRAWVVLGLTGGMIGVIWLCVLWYIQFGASIVWQQVLLATALVLLCVLFCLPVFVLLATLPSAVISFWVTRSSLRQTQKLLSRHQPQIIGLTGSYGKTSTKLLIDQALSVSLDVCTTPGSLNTKYAVSQFLLQQYTGQPYCVIEYAAYTRGEIAALAEYVPPSVAVITGLNQQHLELFGSVPAIVAAKAELIKALPTKASVLWNALDPQVEKIVLLGQRLHQERWGSAAHLVIQPILPQTVGITEWKTSASAKLAVKYKGTWHHTHLVGEQYLSSIALALAVEQLQHIASIKALTAIAAFEPQRGFTRSYRASATTRVLDDSGTSNSQGFAAMIQLSDTLKAQTKVLITSGIPDLGAESVRVHLMLAKQSKQVFDQVWFVGQTSQAGEAEFVAVFGKECVSAATSVPEAALTSVAKSKSVLITLEGKMPAWVYRLACIKQMQ